MRNYFSLYCLYMESQLVSVNMDMLAVALQEMVDTQLRTDQQARSQRALRLAYLFLYAGARCLGAVETGHERSAAQEANQIAGEKEIQFGRIRIFPAGYAAVIRESCGAWTRLPPTSPRSFFVTLAVLFFFAF